MMSFSDLGALHMSANYIGQTGLTREVTEEFGYDSGDT